MEEKKTEPFIDTGPKDVVCHEPIPTFFVDGFQGIALSGGVVRINLVEDRIDSEKQRMNRQVVMRLAMPFEVLDSFVKKLSEVTTQAKEILKTVPVATPDADRK